MPGLFKKTFCTILILFLCSSCSAASGPSSAPSLSAMDTPSLAQPTTGTVVPESPPANPATVPAPSSAATPSPAAQATPSPTPEEEAPLEPYTVAWLNKFAPGSVAAYADQVGDNGDYNKITEYPPADTYKLVVDLNNQCINAYTKGQSGEYDQLCRVMICSTGRGTDPTPIGTFKLGKEKIRFGFFESFDCYAQYWSQITDSIYFHSILYSQRNAKHLIKNSYNNLGKAVSHGCIRMFVPDARWIYQNCAPGTVCQITASIPKNKQLQTALKKGHAGAVDNNTSPKP